MRNSLSLFITTLVGFLLIAIGLVVLIISVSTKNQSMMLVSIILMVFGGVVDFVILIILLRLFIKKYSR